MKVNLLFASFLVFYHILFWQEAAGINLVVFSLLAMVWQKRHSFGSMPVAEWLYAMPFLLSLLGVFFVNSLVSIVVLVLSFTAYSGYLANRQTAVLENFFSGTLSFFSFREPILPEPILKEGRQRPPGLIYARIALIPLLLFGLFFLLFSAGNSIFRQWSNSAFGRFYKIFEDISPVYLLFMFFGLLLVRWIFIKKRKLRLELDTHNYLKRGGSKRKKFSFIGLKHEYLSAIMIFGSLNLLLLVVNWIDVKWVWFQFYVPEQFSLKEFVHEGVGWLILSLIISAALVFYFFRQNLNFYPSNNWLRGLAQVWVFQNLILTVSVALRTFHYIGFHGLASGRIALLVLLAIVAFGLLILSVKVQQKRNAAFTIRWVSAFSLILFGLCSLVNWDTQIARYNLAHGQANEIDVDNYLDLNPQVYPLIYAELSRVEHQIERHNTNETRWINYQNIAEFKKALNKKSESYLKQRSKLTWLSWNPADAAAEAQLHQLMGARKN